MSDAILQWLGGHDTGSSSKTLAIAAMGSVSPSAVSSYPHDTADFGRCYRLIQAAPEARIGLEKLASEGGPYWAALIARWEDVEAAYKADLADRGRTAYDLMRSIYEPIEKADGRFVRLGSGASLRFGQ